ncbi:MAG: hypothetical protein SCARUB_01240 [Candidatus Scalindua rubra]|uniref:YhcG PDDEXK nuclease domain-containing protein n=1 Tax=Candidatus Scalindua rubra TaxID=1872076 RepID=A0A1E3XDG2_9BACT|nr:MAG: hypothetical protein SCARUB_01240 [Candidatus Scalindua rubra]
MYRPESLIIDNNKLKLFEELNKILQDQKTFDVSTAYFNISGFQLIFIYNFYPEKSYYTESQLEQKLIDHLRDFILELGKGFAFVDIIGTIIGTAYFIDIEYPVL